MFERFLGEFGKFKASSGFGVKGEKGGVEVFNELVKGFLSRDNSSVGHLIVPHFGEGNSSSFAHLVEHCHDFPFIDSIDRCIDVEVRFDGFHPAHGVGGFSREVSRECCLEFRVGGEHGGS